MEKKQKIFKVSTWDEYKSGKNQKKILLKDFKNSTRPASKTHSSVWEAK